MVDGNELNAWETVIYYCDQLKVMNYKLEPEYETNFSIFNEPSVENIFTIPMNKHCIPIRCNTFFVPVITTMPKLTG